MWGAGQEEDENPADQSAHIILKVKGLDGNEVFIRIERSTQLKKLMNAYCDRQSVDFNSFGFIFAGRILREEQTPDELGMDDGDEILAILRLFCKVCSEDPRLKLQRKDSQQAMLNKLSGTVRPQSENTESLKPKPVAQSAKPVQKNDIPTIEAKISVLRKLSAPTTSGKLSQQIVVQASVEGLLKSLGLEKYLVTFRAEEVDMTALRHLTDEDLKSLGIPMGPRKKILLAVNSKTKNKGKLCKLLDVIRVLTVLLLFSVLFVHGITSSCRITYFRQIH